MNLVTRLWSFQGRVRRLRGIMSTREAVRFALHRSSSGERSVRLRNSAHATTLRLGTSDVHCFDKVLLRDEYEMPFSVKPDVIVDAGAHIGCATLWYARKYPDAHIVAIEPDEENFRVLEKNCGHLAQVTLVHAALWTEAADLVLEDHGGGNWAFSVALASVGNRLAQKRVPAITIPGILEKCGANRIDILKLDIEGAERNLFARDADRWLARVDVIAIELHDRFLPGCSSSFYRAISRYAFTQEIRGENVFVRIGNPVED